MTINYFNKKKLQPHGGALVLVLIIFMAVSMYCLYFVYDVTKTQYESNEFVYEQNLDTVINSGLSHAKFLLDSDLKLGAADDYRDIWVSVPRGKILQDRLSWSKYISIPTNLKNQKWFKLPGPTDATTLRYRFKLIDTQPVKIANLIPQQPNTPAVWHNKKWKTTDDITAIETKSLEKLINKFESNIENKTFSQKKIAAISDAIDNNLGLNSLANTEPIQFDRIVTQTDNRWIHFDDTLRLGRYYEERGKHNFFLIKDSEIFFNEETGKTNIKVRLEIEPLSPENLFGWEKIYKKFRKNSGLPWWYEDMWKGITAATGGGSNFKYQKIIKSDKLENLQKGFPTIYFEDDKLERFSAGQTVTFHNWFSTLHSSFRLIYRKYGIKKLGIISTAEKDAPDSFIIKPIPRNEKHKISIVTGQKIHKSLVAQASLNGIDCYKYIRYNEEGIAVLNEGEPFSPSTEFMELLIKSPKSFKNIYYQSNNSFKKNSEIFCIEGVLLEQPEFIVLRNMSSKSINLKGWRFGYKLGNKYFWSSPISTSSYFHSKHRKVKADLSPSIPAQKSVILTPDVEQFDYFAGANKNGKWGNSSAEGFPLIEIDKNKWNPKFKVKKVRRGKVYQTFEGTDGGPNWMDPSEGYTWETEWNLYIPGINWSKTKSLLEEDKKDKPLDWFNKKVSFEGEVVFFDPDGDEGNFQPILARIIKQKKRIITIVVSGTRNRFRPTKEATLTFCGIPDIVKEYFLITPEGKIAARAKLPKRNLKRRKNLEQVILEKDGTYKRKNFSWSGISKKLRRREKDFVREPTKNNSELKSSNEKYKILKNSNLSCKSDWFTCDSLPLQFNKSIIKNSKSIKSVSDKAEIRRYENRWLIRKNTENNFPTDSELNPFCNKVYLSDTRSISVEEIISDGIKLSETPGLSPTQYVGKTVVLGPVSSGGGVHIFGSPGSIECEWKNIKNVDFNSAKLTLFGKSANKWTSPVTESQWNNFTNQPVKLTIEIWNYKKNFYEQRVEEKSFDSSDKIFLGKLKPENLKAGRLRMKIITHQSLSPDTSALWLGGVNIHPYAGTDYINVNTISLKTLLSMCKGDTNSAIKILSELNGKKFNSIKSIPEIKNKAVAESKFIIRSDIFDLCVEAQVINKITGKILSQEKKFFKLDRSPARLSHKRIKIIKSSNPQITKFN